MKSIIKVNNVEIWIDEQKHLVPIKPICDALGIDAEGQRQRIEKDEILGSTAFVIKAVAADGKQREMTCLPMKFIFGWLFSISTDRVAEHAKDAVIMYKLECYDALYNYFSEKAMFLEEKQSSLSEKITEYQQIQYEFKNAQKRLNQAKNELNQVKDLSFDEWKVTRKQLTLPFHEE